MKDIIALSKRGHLYCFLFNKFHLKKIYFLKIRFRVLIIKIERKKNFPSESRRKKIDMINFFHRSYFLSPFEALSFHLH